MEELTEQALDEFMAGYFAAMKGDPFWQHNTTEWREGYAFFRLTRAKKDADQCTHH